MPETNVAEICPSEFALCVPSMGMILWGESPLYIFREVIWIDNF